MKTNYNSMAYEFSQQEGSPLNLLLARIRHRTNRITCYPTTPEAIHTFIYQNTSLKDPYSPAIFHAKEQSNDHVKTKHETKICQISFRQQNQNGPVMFRVFLQKNHIDLWGRESVLQFCVALTKFDPLWKFYIRASKRSIVKSPEIVRNLKYLVWLWNLPPIDMVFVRIRTSPRIE